MRVFAILIIAGMIAGCQTTPPPLPPDELNRIETRTFNEPFDRVFSAVLETLRDANYPIAVADPQSGLITTDDVLPEGHPIAETKAGVRSKWSVRVTRTGKNQTTVRARWFYAIRGKNWGQSTFSDAVGVVRGPPRNSPTTRRPKTLSTCFLNPSLPITRPC